MYSVKLLEGLDWPVVKQHLAQLCAAEPSKQWLLGRDQWMQKEEVEIEWNRIDQLAQLARAGFSVPLGDFADIQPNLEFVSRGGVLEGPQLLELYMLLELSQAVAQFAKDFVGRCPHLKDVQTSLYLLPHVRDRVSASIDRDGEIKDNATSELKKIRTELHGYTQKIELALQKWMQSPANAKYLQDQFFTIRSDRYVVPLKLDGNGRVDVRVVDTSGSGSSVFVEPFAIKALNDHFLQLRLRQRIEELKILRELSELVNAESEFLQYNFNTLRELDVRIAKSKLGISMNATIPSIAGSYQLDLSGAHHPLLYLQDPESSVGQDIALEAKQKCLIVSGPNAGGKTISLKIIGLLQLMARAGLLLPVRAESKFCFFESLHVELGDAQDLGQNLSSFSGHLRNIKKISSEAAEGSLILLDEIASGTDAATGAALAQALVESWIGRGAFVVVTTHLDKLKNLALESPEFRNASVAFDFDSNKPLFRLLLDVPGSSLGVELAERLEFGPEITQRAKELRNADSSGESQELLDQLRRKVQELENQKKGLQATRKELDVERARWEHEKDIVVAAKKTTRSKVRDEYSRKFESMERGFFSLTDQLKKLIKESKKKSSDQLQAELGSLTQQFGQRYASAKESSRNASEVSVREGPVVADDLVKGKTVFVVSLQKKVKVTQTIEKSKLTKYLELLAASEGAALSSELKGFLKRQKIEVAIGALKSFVALVDLKSLA